MSSFEGIVLDIDNTLIYSVFLTKDQSENEDETKIDFSVEKLQGLQKLECYPISIQSYDKKEEYNIEVYFRPYLKEFISLIFKKYKVGLWSLGKKEYVNKIAELLNIGTDTINPKAQYKASFIYNWNDCHRENYTITKPLSKSPFKSIKAFIIEDRFDVCDKNDSCVIVDDFEGDPEDVILKLLISQITNYKDLTIPI